MWRELILLWVSYCLYGHGREFSGCVCVCVRVFTLYNAQRQPVSVVSLYTRSRLYFFSSFFYDRILGWQWMFIYTDWNWKFSRISNWATNKDMIIYSPCPTCDGKKLKWFKSRLLVECKQIDELNANQIIWCIRTQTQSHTQRTHTCKGAKANKRQYRVYLATESSGNVLYRRAIRREPHTHTLSHRIEQRKIEARRATSCVERVEWQAFSGNESAIK